MRFLVVISRSRGTGESMMTTTQDEKKTFFECLWCHTSYDSTQFSSDELTEGPDCPLCGDPLERVEADAPEAAEETPRNSDDEIVDYWHSSIS